MKEKESKYTHILKEGVSCKGYRQADVVKGKRSKQQIKLTVWIIRVTERVIR